MAHEICPSCGKAHDALSGSIPVSMPTKAAEIPSIQRDERLWSNGELCVIDDEKFYLYGSIEMEILEHSEGFIWGAWVEITEERFFWYQDQLDAEGRENCSPFKATLATDIPFYPVTLGLPLDVHIQPRGMRPQFVLEAGAHPLIHDQHSGVSAEQIGKIKSWFQSLKSPADPNHVTDTPSTNTACAS